MYPLPRGHQAPAGKLDKITCGNGTLEDIDKLEELCHYIKENSLCGLGQTAPNPVLSTLKFFRDEYVAHVVDKMPGRRLQGPASNLHRGGQVQGLHRLRA